jgi:hypothetical protein
VGVNRFVFAGYCHRFMPVYGHRRFIYGAIIKSRHKTSFFWRNIEIAPKQNANTATESRTRQPSVF